MTTNGKPYKPEKYRAIIRDQVYISSNTGATYSDTESMTPYERDLWMETISNNNKSEKEKIQEMANNHRKT